MDEVVRAIAGLITQGKVSCGGTGIWNAALLKEAVTKVRALTALAGTWGLR